jgi:type IV pilus assembly protein PilA
MNPGKGFTLIELMVVISIIGILASIAVPQYSVYIHRTEVTEAISIASGVREKISAYYVENLSFPENNSRAGIPEPSKMIGNRIIGVIVDGGAIHVQMGNKASKPLQGKTLTLRPAVVDGSPASPIAWLCGYDEPVAGMTAVGVNQTDIGDTLLPSVCRKY